MEELTVTRGVIRLAAHFGGRGSAAIFKDDAINYARHKLFDIRYSDDYCKVSTNWLALASNPVI